MDDKLHDITLLKQLAKNAELLSQPDNTTNAHWRAAYIQIARGTNLLWRLLDASGGDGKTVIVDK